MRRWCHAFTLLAASVIVIGCSEPAAMGPALDSGSGSVDSGQTELPVPSVDAGKDAGSTATIDAGVTPVDAGTRDSGPELGPPDLNPACRADGDGKTTAVFVNHCTATLEVRGSDIEGATLSAGQSVCRDLGSDVEPLSAKRYWGFLGDDPGAEHHTLAEFTFNTDFNDFDWYNISHVDAHNLTMQIVPLDRPDCDTLSCPDTTLLSACPTVGRFTNGQGDLVACVSPDRDDGNSQVAIHFETCDDAYAWSGDDQHGEDPSPVRACAGEDWAIVFCP